MCYRLLSPWSRVQNLTIAIPCYSVGGYGKNVTIFISESNIWNYKFYSHRHTRMKYSLLFLFLSMLNLLGQAAADNENSDYRSALLIPAVALIVLVIAVVVVLKAKQTPNKRTGHQPNISVACSNPNSSTESSSVAKEVDVPGQGTYDRARDFKREMMLRQTVQNSNV
ncbi:uncharacterized protein LOC106061215 [Biomphalaria glabrata]|uniref:Uncharacterized protein LOC106061215 n=1 Tax=Biomphalaria glabrata TaxID=6526 RepID=A0A2C9LV30_BIOGL|nr:uncharacterized protein LOC106061215 [Biomphalaria glabrata]